jgi:UDP-2-acetamido-2,6-beta-L-arabino-hexul-4-ose reductase
MVIGSGQLASSFCSLAHSKEVIIFASGVSNSNTNDHALFLRERELLLETLLRYKGCVIVYFSSCALSAKGYYLNAYYQHKRAMESLILSHSQHYYIFRLPQLFGDLKEHSTLINFFYYAIKDQQHFTLYSDAYRYVIDIDDTVYLVKKYLLHHSPKLVVDLANSHKYRVKEIVEILESLLDKRGDYDEVSYSDDYHLNLEPLHHFMNRLGVNLGFGVSYLEERLQKRVARDLLLP